MTLSDAEILELNELCSAVVDDALTETQQVRLQQMLQASPEARQLYIRTMALSADLFDAAGNTQSDAPDRMPEVKLSVKPNRKWLIVSAAATAACLLLSVLLFSERSTRQSSETEPLSTAVATLEAAAGPQWPENQPALRAGAVLDPGWIKLQAGLIQVRFYSGAQVFIKGPAEFNIVSEMEGYCRVGAVTGEVPPQAKNFKIGSPRVTVVDLGTSFGLMVRDDGSSEVHVFSGKVELLPAETSIPTTTLAQDQAVGIPAKGNWTPVTLNRDLFPSPNTLQQQVDLEAGSRLKSWKEGLARQRDETLLLHYTFQPEEDGTKFLKNHGSLKEAANGVIVSGEWTAGRWPGKGALEFKSESDRVRLNASGEYPAATWAAWIRINALPNSLNALLVFDSVKKGQYHWHISSKGEIRFGLRWKSTFESARSPAVITPDLTGQWIHLATTYDSSSGAVVHYLNGNEVSRHTLTPQTTLKLEDGEIGNGRRVSGSGEALPRRNFNGRIDEMILFNRALTGAEIKQLFISGDPNK